MISGDFKTLLASHREKVDAGLLKWLPSTRTSLCAKLNEAMAYSVFAGGKRIRPVLLILTAEAFGCSGEVVVRAGCAVELLHTYSLIHDDLPALDNDNLRRGRPANHKVFGDAFAILAGDALLTLSFEWLSGLNEWGVPDERCLRILRIFSRAVGHNGMIGSQCLDLEAEERNVGIDDLAIIHRNKTGTLLASCVEIGGLIAGAGSDDMAHLKDYGEKIGLLFQILDDILDVVSDSQTLGKTPGKDQQAGKATYPALMGIEESRTLAGKVGREAVAIAEKLSVNAPHLAYLAGFLISRTK